MAVRTVEYTVSVDKISPASVQKGGVQGEHCATKIVFNIDAKLRELLADKKPNGAESFYYRFEAHTGSGTKANTEPKKIEVKNLNSVEYELENWLTRDGGNIRVYLVISYINAQNSETLMDLYTYPAFLKLEPVPDAELTDGENYESLTTLSESAKKSAERAENAADIAVDNAASLQAAADSAADSAAIAEENAKISQKAAAKCTQAEQILEQCEKATEKIEDIKDAIDEDGFLKSIEETNKELLMQFWVGTEEEYKEQTSNNTNYTNNCLYLLTDDTLVDEINEKLDGIEGRLDVIESRRIKSKTVTGKPTSSGNLWLMDNTDGKKIPLSVISAGYLCMPYISSTENTILAHVMTLGASHEVVANTSITATLYYMEV